MNVLISGTSQGIGKAIAVLFLERGHRVFGIDRQVSGISHESYTHYICDVRDYANLPALSDIHVLINNAGIYDTWEPFLASKSSTWKKKIDVNILGTMGGPSVVGFIVLVVAFVIGHLLNIAINVLGTFVHTSRLQYIEFFNKFYEDGGVPFEPAEPSDKYTEE